MTRPPAHLLLPLLLWGCVEDLAAPAPGAPRDLGPPPETSWEPPCVEDRLGPSTPELVAAQLGSGTYAALMACPGQPDHFEIAGPAGAGLTVWIEADAAVTVQLGGTLVGAGRSLVGRARLGLRPVPLVIDAAVSTAYRLRVEIHPLLEDCVDPHEATEAEGASPVLAPGRSITRALCTLGDIDWLAHAGGEPSRWQVQHLGGEPAWFDLFIERESQQDEALRVDGRWLTQGASATFVAPAVDPGGRHRLRIAGPGLTQYRISLESTRAGGPVLENVIRIEVPWRPSPDAGWRWLPAAQLHIDQLGADGEVQAASRAVRGSVIRRQAGLALWARAEAWAGRHRVSVGPEELDDRPWAVELLIQGDEELARPDPGDPVAPALAVALIAADALRQGLAQVPPARLRADPPPLHITWRPGGAAACGSCFRPSPSDRPRIDLSGSRSDPDEGDLAVIRHEVAHYLTAVYSRDTSPGGRHDGRAVEPQLAWSEGFATFFASWIAGDPVQVDWRLTGPRTVDLEHPAHPDAQRPWGPPWGRVSDHLVAALLWDLADDTPDEDPHHLPDGLLFKPVFGAMFDSVAGGATPGADLLDYLDGLACTPEAPEDLGATWLRDYTPTCRLKAGLESGAPSQGLAGTPAGPVHLSRWSRATPGSDESARRSTGAR